MITRYENARLFTACQEAGNAFAVRDGRFVMVGSAEDVRNAYPDAPCVNLEGRFVCPGFNDSHMHLLSLGGTLNQASLGKNSLQSVLAEVAAFAQAHPQESFILGRGFNHDHFIDEPRFPTRWELDAACPDRPCLITRVCGHAAVANSRALEIAGIAASAQPVHGGQIDTDELGVPTGVLRENAINLISAIIPKPDRAAVKHRLLAAMDYVRAFGITSVQSDDFSSVDVPFEEIIAAYQELKAEGRMSVRVNEQCNLPSISELERFLAAGYRTGWGDDLFRIGPVKLLLDGSLGARTALLRAPYSDDPRTSGIAAYGQDEFNALILRAHEAGMQIAVHAIGDGAVDMALEAFERALDAVPRPDHRHGLVHMQIIDHAQTARMQKLGLHGYVQSVFLDYDTQIVEARIGSRAQQAYPAASLRRQGISFSNGSDCPVEKPDVLAGIQCAVTRKPYQRETGNTYLPGEALSMADALISFTRSGAWASREEDSKGIIAPGYLADFTILGIDPFETDPRWLHRIPVKAAYMNGSKVY